MAHTVYQRIESLLVEAKEMERRDVKAALSLAEKALTLSSEHGFHDTLAKSKMRIGRCYWINNDFGQARSFLTEALELSTKLEDQETKAESYIGLGNIYVTMQITDVALNYYHSALSLVEAHALDEQEVKLTNNLGALHEELKNYDEALKYFHLSREKAEAVEYHYGVAIADINLGNIYLELDKLDVAYKHIERAHTHAKSHDRQLLLAHCAYALGQFHRKHAAYTQAIEHLNQAIDSSHQSKDYYILVRIYMELGKTYAQAKRIDEAKNHYKKAYTLALNMDSVEYRLSVHEQLAKFYETNHFDKAASKHFKAYLETNIQVQEHRRLERIKNTEFQTKLNHAIQETKTYRIMSDELKKTIDQMQVLNTIGRSMTATHDLKTIFDQLYHNIHQLMPSDSLAIAIYDPDKASLNIELHIENHQPLEPFSLQLDNPNSLTVYSFKQRETLLINDIEKDYNKYISKVYSSRGNLMHSAMYTPLIFEEELIGTLSVQSKQRHAFHDTDKVLLETLASYLTIAINNAKHIKELARLNKKFKRLSELDGLTGVPNRRAFDATLNALWTSCQKNLLPLTMIFVDIDNFKEFNDAYGHLKGDEVLKAVASHLESAKPPEAFVARYGGDEFVMMLPNTDLEAAKALAKDLAVSIKELTYEGIETTLNVSLGLGTTIPKAPNTCLDFLAFVDQQLYESKNKGKNQIIANNL